MRTGGIYCFFVLFGLVLTYQVTAMDFQELHKGTDCDCISSAVQNCTDTFSRRVGEEGRLKDRNFKLPPRYQNAPFIDCENHCSSKSLSIDLWNEESQEIVIKVHRSNPSFGLAPKFRPQLLIFKIKQYGGLVKHSPSRKNKYHHNYYKPDNFKAPECLDYIKTVKLNYNDV